MAIENIPDIYLKSPRGNPELFAYDFRMTEEAINTRVNLNMNMFSFIQFGKKQVHFAGTSIAVNKNQSLLIKKGNCLWTELLDKEQVYYCKLLFFSQKILLKYLEKHIPEAPAHTADLPYFIIKNDPYINAFIASLSAVEAAPEPISEKLLEVKFEEIILYLSGKYGKAFTNYLHSLIRQERSAFKDIIEDKKFSNLRLEEISFLCNMSLSTFKRHFVSEYKMAPGKWLQEQRLIKAKELLQEGILKPSDIYLDVGYRDLSNFSIAFKNKFGLSPKEAKIKGR